MKPVKDALQVAFTASEAVEAEHARQLQVLQERLAKAMEREQQFGAVRQQFEVRVKELEQQLAARDAQMAAMQEHPAVKAKMRAEAEAHVVSMEAQLAAAKAKLAGLESAPETPPASDPRD